MKAETLKAVPDIIKAASGTNLGILALLILVLALLGFIYFRKSSAVYQFGVFLLVFCGTAAFGLAAIQAQRMEASSKISFATQAIEDLKLTLVFSQGDGANPRSAKVNAFVQKKNESEERPANDIIQKVNGPGGLTVYFSKLVIGDKVRIEVEDAGKRWTSYDMRMLEANLEMRPQN